MGEVRISMGDRGRTVPVAVGDRVVLSLPENATTGMRWILAETDAVELVGDENRLGEPGIGAEGERILTLRPRRPGTVRLRLLRRQAWEDEASADAAFEIDLDAS